MIKKILLFLFTFLNISNVYALPGTLHLSIIVKNNNLCVFISKGNKNLSVNALLRLQSFEVYKNRNGILNYTSMQKEKNPPINQENCIEFPQSKFKENQAYDLFLEREVVYSTRICLRRNHNLIVLYNVEKGFVCSNNEIKSNLDKNFWIKVKSILRLS
ncbi:NF045616 family extracytoplasmic (lipo)protein [Acinetobacter ursingii]|uniref:NF045616 family extracytoplasmic (lipo)protein n=1 Tax=Acinetobacter ursingii TaxID=108980 RepID=UPI0021CD546C|nr:NF045616 family extracytoplasmic (lipo)protein [Acinetobacter ursingii]MCU4482491.1 hypothetical protein [Acinetobacter ursingii]MCU4506869.1 hypothetical protein [Acinetobacter ursingii]